MLRNLLRIAPLLFAIAPFVACSADGTEEESDTDDGALIGGSESGPQDDAVVALFRRGEPHCAATVIGQNVLLTALHCVTDVEADGRLGMRLQPTELTVHMSSKPASQRAATVSRIVVPDSAEQPGAMLRSNDIAAIYVQPLDPQFAQIRPRPLAQQPMMSDRQVSVVGYTNVARDPFGIFTTLRRQRRDGVFVWAGAPDRSMVQAVLEDGRSFYWRNRPLEITTELVACGSDSGGPAFDTQGNLAGIVVGVVGECVAGSLSVFTDVASHAPFIQKVLGGTGTMCLNDAQCGSAASGRVCDAKTQRCIRGCRTGGVQCIAGQTCSAAPQPGALGICRTKSGPLDPTDPLYDQGPYAAPENANCPGDPLCPVGAGTRECMADTDCRGQNGIKPRVCDIPRGRCLDGCRVGAATMCAQGQACGASQDDPAIGLCQVGTTPAPAPGAPPASPPTYQSEPPPPAGTDVTGGSSYTNETDSDGGVTKKKKKNKAKGGEAGCSVGTVGTSSTTAAFPLALGLLGLTLRRRRNAR